MQITQQIIDEFKEHVEEANKGMFKRAARLQAKTSWYQTESSMLAVLRLLQDCMNQNIDLAWDGCAPTEHSLAITEDGVLGCTECSDHNQDGISGEIAKVELKKQRKYSKAVKYLQRLLGELPPQKMFPTLNHFGTKLTKVQQRYTIPMLTADEGVTIEERKHAAHGLCQNLSLLWLKEQFSRFPSFRTQFPALKGQNVIASKKAYAVTKKAAQMKGSPSEAGKTIGLELTAKPINWKYNFSDIARGLERDQDSKGFYMEFAVAGTDRHSLAVFRENAGTYLFFDSNAGSYRCADADALLALFVDYSVVCLPKKWPTLRTHVPAAERWATESLKVQAVQLARNLPKESQACAG